MYQILDNIQCIYKDKEIYIATNRMNIESVYTWCMKYNVILTSYPFIFTLTMYLKQLNSKTDIPLDFENYMLL